MQEEAPEGALCRRQTGKPQSLGALGTEAKSPSSCPSCVPKMAQVKTLQVREPRRVQRGQGLSLGVKHSPLSLQRPRTTAR